MRPGRRRRRARRGAHHHRTRGRLTLPGAVRRPPRAVVRSAAHFKPVAEYAREARERAAQQRARERAGTAEVPGARGDRAPARVALAGADPGAALLAPIAIEERVSADRNYNPVLVDAAGVSKVSRKGFELQVRESFMMSLRERSDQALAAEMDQIAGQMCDDYGIGCARDHPPPSAGPSARRPLADPAAVPARARRAQHKTKIVLSIREQVRQHMGSPAVQEWIRRQRPAADAAGAPSTSAPAWDEDALADIHIHVRADGVEIRDRCAAGGRSPPCGRRNGGGGARSRPTQ